MRGSETNRTIVLSRTRFEGQDRRGKTLQKFRQQRTMPFGQKAQDSLPINNIVITRHVIVGILPCGKITSLRQDAHMAKICHFRHVEADEKPSKESKKGGAKGPVALLKESVSTGLCVSRFSSEKVYSTERNKIGIEAHRQILPEHMEPIKKSRNKGSIQRDDSEA